MPFVKIDKAGKVILFLAGLFIVSSGQIAFINNLPGWFGRLNVVLVVAVFILGAAGLPKAIWWAAGGGLLLDLMSFTPFGIHLLGLSFVVLVSHLLLENFFTNRSLYTFLVLISESTVILNLFYAAFSLYGPARLSGVFSAVLINWLVGSLALNAGLTFLIFITFNFLSDRLKPVFIIKRQDRIY